MYVRWQLAALVAAGLTAGSAYATPVTPPDVLGTGRLAGVEDAQFFFGGQNYCFYPDGWHGPGFYWCGYAYRNGFGWGGPSGWNGWSGRGPGRGPGAGFGHGRGPGGFGRGPGGGHPGGGHPGGGHPHGGHHGGPIIRPHGHR